MSLEWFAVNEEYVALPLTHAIGLNDWLRDLLRYAHDAKACLDALAEGVE